MENQVFASSVAKGRTPGVWLFSMSLLLGGAGEILRIILEAGKGEVFLGFVWVESANVSALVHGLMAFFCIISAIGLLRLRPFGFWMLLALHVFGAACLLLWWLRGRAVTIAHGGEPAGVLFLAIVTLWYVVVFAWCYTRRANFAMRRGHRTVFFEEVQTTRGTHAILILGIIAIVVAGIVTLPFVVFAVDWLFVKLLRIIFQLW